MEMVCSHHLGSKGLQWLTKLYTKTMESVCMPKTWQEVVVIAVLKLVKPVDLGSYRPISLLCTTYKLLEHITLRRISHFIEPVIPDEQAGFWPK